MANRLVEAAMAAAPMYMDPSTRKMLRQDRRMERKQSRVSNRESNRESRREERGTKRAVCRKGLCGGRAKGYIGY